MTPEEVAQKSTLFDYLLFFGIVVLMMVLIYITAGASMPVKEAENQDYVEE